MFARVSGGIGDEKKRVKETGVPGRWGRKGGQRAGDGNHLRPECRSKQTGGGGEIVNWDVIGGLNSASRGDGSGRCALEILRGNISGKKSVKTFRIRPFPRPRKKSMIKTSKMRRIREKKNRKIHTHVGCILSTAPHRLFSAAGGVREISFARRAQVAQTTWKRGRGGEI